MVTKATVCIVKTKPQPEANDVEQAVRQAIALLGGIEDTVQPGNLVIVKPNILGNPVDYAGNYLPGVCTSREVSRAVAQVVRELGARPVIAESSQVGDSTEVGYRTMGYDRLRDEGFEVIDLKMGQRQVTVACPKGKVFKKMTTWEIVSEADALISVPVMKTHDVTDVTLGLKNLKGLYTDAMKRRAHSRQLFQQVADWATVVPPSLTVVDGIVGMEGMGPVDGLPVEMDLIIAGKDPVATDAVTSAVMGFDPAEVAIAQLAAEHGLGCNSLDEIEVVGEPVAKVAKRFIRAEEDNRLSLPDLQILHSEGTCSGCRRAFRTTLLELTGAGLSHLLQDTVVLTGSGVIPEEVAMSDLVTIGRCVPARNRVGRAHVQGCPPNTAPQMRALLNGHSQFEQFYRQRRFFQTAAKDFL
jgi:uncharacterized protein (DUF362 family)